jgi:hypothetical protein
MSGYARLSTRPCPATAAACQTHTIVVGGQEIRAGALRLQHGRRRCRQHDRRCAPSAIAHAQATNWLHEQTSSKCAPRTTAESAWFGP